MVRFVVVVNNACVYEINITLLRNLGFCNAHDSASQARVEVMHGIIEWNLNVIALF
jgi:hypothetical protein